MAELHAKKQPPKKKTSITCNPRTDYRVLENGTKEGIVEMLQRNVDSNYINERGDTVLHAVLRNDKLIEKDVTDILLVFLPQGICPNTKNNNEETALHLAFERRMKNAVDCLLKFKADIHTVDKQGNSMAHFFIKDEYKKCNSSMNDPIMDTLEYRDAMENESVTFLQFLWAKGVNFNNKNIEGRSASHLAIVYYLPHILSILLYQIDDIMTVGELNKTLLELMLEESIPMSRSHLPDENQYPGYKSRCAAMVFRILLNKITSVAYERVLIVDFLKKKRKITIMQALMDYTLSNCENKDYAATLEGKNLRMMELLKDSDIVSSFKSNNGQNLLHWLAEEKNTRRIDYQCDQICDFLVFHGCKVNAIDSNGKSALHAACAHSNVPMVRKLIELGADLDCRDKFMRTPLHEAVAKNKSKAIVELLLNSGAEVNVEDSKGGTPLRFSGSNANGLISILLIINGADVAGKCKTLSFFDVILIDKLLKCKSDFNDHGVRRLITSETMLRGFKRNWIRLEAIGLSLDEEYKLLIDEEYDSYYRAECLEETKKLKLTFIDDRKSLYDFLQMPASNREAYVNNEKLQHLVKSRCTLFWQFEHYSAMIRASYREAVTRKTKLLEPAKAAFYELIQGKLNADAIDYILAYLNNEELVSIMEAESLRKNCLRDFMIRL